MADTPRTFSQLYALFADNTVGAISPQDLRDFVATLDAHEAATDPTANDDVANTSGNGIFDIRSAWRNTSDNGFFICVDPTAGAAVWKEVGATGTVSGGLDGTTVEALTWDTATQSLDWDTSAVKTIALSSNVTTQTFLNTPPNGEFGYMQARITPTTTGLTIDWHANVEWENGPPNMAAMKAGEDLLFAFQVDDGSRIIGAHNKPSLINYQTGTTYTIQASDAGKTLRHNNSSPIAVSIPTESTSGFPQEHDFEGVQFGAGPVTYTPAAGVTIFHEGVTISSVSATTSITTSGRHKGLAFQYQGNNVWLAMGQIA